MTTKSCFAVALLVCAATAQAQSYPTQPIRLIVPWPPGGGVDTSARIISQPLTNSGSQGDISAIVRRRTGAGEPENGRIVRRGSARGG